MLRNSSKQEITQRIVALIAEIQPYFEGEAAGVRIIACPDTTAAYFASYTESAPGIWRSGTQGTPA